MVDIRHPLKDSDWQMLAWAREFGMQVLILLTKADKLSRGAGSARLQEVRNELRRAGVEAQTQTFSALRGIGLEQALAHLDAWFLWDTPLSDGQLSEEAEFEAAEKEGPATPS